jgi:hypothetical protein
MQEFKYREGRDSEEMRLKVQQALKRLYPGVSKDQAGPPAGYPINIEITGKDYTELIVAERMKDFIR